MNNVDIHVAIPTHNNADDLGKLLNELVTQNFASITVLDDASTDNTDEIVQTFKDVKYIKSEINLGTVGANNMILRDMPTSGYLLCIDSDMAIQTKDIPAAFDTFLSEHTNTGAAVGRIIDEFGNTKRWNYGFDINPGRSILAFITYHLALVTTDIPVVAKLTRSLSLPFTPRLASCVDRKIDWGIESFFFVRVDLWQKLNGFDSRFKRFHEGPDLFLQIRKMGYETWFIAGIVAQDIDQHTGTTLGRRYHWWRSLVIYFWKNPSRLFIYRYPRP